MKKIIDISQYNTIGNLFGIDGTIDGVMIRCTSGFVEDNKAREHVEKAIENNIPFGFYMFSKATSRAELIRELKFFHQTASTICAEKGVWAHLPLAVDIEHYIKESNARKKILDTEDSFAVQLYTIKDYFTKEQIPYLIYMSFSDFNKFKGVALEIIPPDNRWVARYKYKTGTVSIIVAPNQSDIDCMMWQYTSDFYDLLNANLDINIAYDNICLIG